MIKVNDVSMRFVMANDKISSIKEFVTAMASRKLKFKEFWALHDVSFEVKKGEVVGIIGRNGAGKSTILKIISGILTPTLGNVERNGNIVPMLELGSGFDYDLSGRENIFLNGAILGYSQKFLEEKYDEILAFSELGDFIDMPIRNYSSGMLMRLAFSIATVVQPEILIVDEILAVGDETFQKKSKARMMELMSGGTTVLFVSHSMDQIREMCDRVVWLDKGTVRMFGPTDEVCDAYDISAPDRNRNTFSEKDEWVEKTLETIKKNNSFFKGMGKHNIFHVGTVDNGRPEDYQVTVSERQWINDTFGKHYRIVEIPADKYWRIKRYLKQIIEKDDIIIGSGGETAGIPHSAAEEIKRDYVRAFPGNKIIIMPGRICPPEAAESVSQIELTKELFGKHKKLTLLVNGNENYEKTKADYACEVIKIPELEFNAGYYERKVHGEYVAVYIAGSNASQEEIKALASSINPDIRVIDTQAIVNAENSEAELERIWGLILGAGMVVTDSLKYLTYSAAAGIPCIAVNDGHDEYGISSEVLALPYVANVSDVKSALEASGTLKNGDTSLASSFKAEFEGLKTKLLK